MLNILIATLFTAVFCAVLWFFLVFTLEVHVFGSDLILKILEIRLRPGDYYFPMYFIRIRYFGKELTLYGHSSSDWCIYPSGEKFQNYLLDTKIRDMEAKKKQEQMKELFQDVKPPWESS